VNTHAAPPEPLSLGPPINNVLPSADSAALLPNRASSPAWPDVSFSPCWINGSIVIG